MKKFLAEIKIIGVNPYVFLPDEVLNFLFGQAGKNKGPIPVRGLLEGKPFKQTLVRYKSAWRLYLNTKMRDDSKTKVGDKVWFEIEYDPKPRVEPMNPALTQEFAHNKKAKEVFESLIPSRQKEILRYLNSIKTEESRKRNVERVITFLSGEKPDKLHPLLRIKK